MCTGVYSILMYIFTHAQTQPKNTSVECTKFSKELGTTEMFLQMNLKKWLSNNANQGKEQHIQC